MKDQTVRTALKLIAEREVPDTVNLWPAVRAELSSRNGESRRRSALRKPALGWALATCLAVLLTATTVYAVSPILNELFQMASDLRFSENQRSDGDINLSQTIDGVTVTVEKVYADAHQITIGYTYRSDRYPQASLSPKSVTLVEDNGTVFDTFRSMGIRDGDGSAGFALTFDSSPLQGTPTELNLRMAMELAGSGALPPNGKTTVGPYSFNFSVPFVPARVVGLSQPAERNGATLTLEQVTFTPSKTATTICLEGDGLSEFSWQFEPALETRAGAAYQGGTFALADYNWDFSQTPPQIRFGESDAQLMQNLKNRNCYRSIFDIPPSGATGQWTLTVKELSGLSKANPTERKIIKGPWVFRFSAP